MNTNFLFSGSLGAYPWGKGCPVSLTLWTVELRMPLLPDGVCERGNNHHAARQDRLAWLPGADFVSSLRTDLKDGDFSICWRAVEFGQGTEAYFLLYFYLCGLTCLTGMGQVRSNAALAQGTRWDLAGPHLPRPAGVRSQSLRKRCARVRANAFFSVVPWTSPSSLLILTSFSPHENLVARERETSGH